MFFPKNKECLLLWRTYNVHALHGQSIYSNGNCVILYFHFDGGISNWTFAVSLTH